MFNRAGDRCHLPRSARGGKSVEIFRQDFVTGNHVKHPFTGSTSHSFHCANRDGVFASRQLRDGDSEVCAVDILAKRLWVRRSSFDGQRRAIFVMRETAAHVYLRTT